MKIKKQKPIPSVFLICLSSLVLLGLVILYSASSPLGMERFGDPFYYLKRQLVFVGIGLVGFYVFQKIPYRFWLKWSWGLLGIAAFFLMLVFVPGLGKTAGGAQRWIQLGGYNFQPSEFAKLALVIFLAASIARKQNRMREFSIGVLPHFLFPSVILLLVLLQPDFGSFMTLSMFIFSMLFIGGARLKHLLTLILAGLPAIYLLVASADYRRKRFFAFLDPWADVQETGFQIIQSQVAFHRGGLTGVGLGEGQQKLFYLPDIHTDFVFSVVGEELGFLGVVLVVALFLGFTLVGFQIASRAQKAGAVFASFLAIGLTLLIALPAFLNMGVVLGLLPTKGMVLPFLSYGGSALLVSMAASGILLNLARGVWHEDLV